MVDLNVYQEQLDIKKGNTIGIEIEFEEADYFITEKFIRSYKILDDWVIKDDESVQRICWDDKFGGEITSPILRNTKEDWEQLKKVCEILKVVKAECREKAAAHIHIGAQILKNNSIYWENFLKLWAVYEKEIFQFTYGEKNRQRYFMQFYSIPAALNIINNLDQFQKNKGMQVKDILKHFDAGKIQALNLSNLTYELSSRQTIEFRCPNGTINAHTWQKNVLFFIRLLEYATNPHFDEELINYHINHFDFNKANLKNYNQIGRAHV